MAVDKAAHNTLRGVAGAKQNLSSRNNSIKLKAARTLVKVDSN